VLSDRNVVKSTDAKTLELRDEHWQLMSDLLPVLKPLQIATSVLSAEVGVTASVVYPMLLGLVGDHLAACADDSTAVSAFKVAVVDALRVRFALKDVSTARNMFVCASVLDPKFKHLPGLFT